MLQLKITVLLDHQVLECHGYSRLFVIFCLLLGSKGDKGDQGLHGFEVVLKIYIFINLKYFNSKGHKGTKGDIGPPGMPGISGLQGHKGFF